MNKAINTVALIVATTTIILFSGYHSEQSKEHHENYHKLIKENYRLNEWYQNWSINNDCDTFRQPISVSINCEKYEL